MTSIVDQPFRSNLIPGLWLVVAPFAFGLAFGNPLWENNVLAVANNVLVGFVIVLVGWYMYQQAAGGETAVTGSSVNTLLGLWIAVSPFLLNPGAALLWNNVIVGLLVAGFDIHYPKVG